MERSDTNVEIVKDINEQMLEDELARALYAKYRQRSSDVGGLARDDAATIVRNLDVILPVLGRLGHEWATDISTRE